MSYYTRSRDMKPIKRDMIPIKKETENKMNLPDTVTSSTDSTGKSFVTTGEEKCSFHGTVSGDLCDLPAGHAGPHKMDYPPIG